jgi:hypothetical protein
MVTTLYNQSGVIGYFIVEATSNVTGSMFLTFIALLFIMIACIFLLRIPFSIGLFFMYPVVITLMAYNSAFLPFGGVIILIISLILAKSFLDMLS